MYSSFDFTMLYSLLSYKLDCRKPCAIESRGARPVRPRSVPDQSQSAVPHNGTRIKKKSDWICMRQPPACTLSTSAESPGRKPAIMDVTGRHILLRTCHANQSGGADFAGNIEAYCMGLISRRPHLISHLVALGVKRQNSAVINSTSISDSGEMQ